MHNHIREFRQARGMTQEELARKSGVRRETIVFLEQEKYNPSLELAVNVARALKTPITEVFDLR